MALDPWSYADTGKEHSHQVALFMWANMAEKFGLGAAEMPASYNTKGFAKAWFEEFGGPLVPKLKWFHAISNHGSGFGRKAEGVKTGVSDMFLPVPTQKSYNDIGWLICGFYIELKRPLIDGKKAGVVSKEQLNFQTDMREAGYACEIAYGWLEARDAILKYLGLC